jgi:hypothetical protein
MKRKKLRARCFFTDCIYRDLDTALKQSERSPEKTALSPFHWSQLID